MANPETVSAIGYAAWASYLINGDDSGISPDERKAADEFHGWLAGGYCRADIVDCDSESFFATPDSPYPSLPGDCVEYRALAFRHEWGVHAGADGLARCSRPGCAAVAT